MDSLHWTRKVQIETSSIDGLRGFAVFHIIVGHLFLFSNFRDLQSDVLVESCGASGGIYLMGGGSMGLFYIISGFVMAVGYCQLLLQAPRGCSKFACFCWPVRDDDGNINYNKLNACDFWIRRLVRLAPTYYLTNIVGICMRRTFSPDVPTAEPFRWDSFVLTFLGLSSWSLRFPMGNELTWTISTMLFFYLCFPALAPRLQRLHPSSLPKMMWAMYAIQVILMLVGFLGLQNYWIRMYPLARLPIFIMGMCCGLIRVHQQQVQADLEDQDATPVSIGDRPQQAADNCCCCALEPFLHPSSIVCCWFVMSASCSVGAYFCSNFLIIILRGLLEIIFPIFFFHWVLAFTSPVNQTTYIVSFKSRPMRFLGDISMCSYMIHMLLAEALGLYIGRVAGNYPWWMILAILPSTILLGWCLTTFFEKPLARCLRPDRRAAGSNAPPKAEGPAVIGSPQATPEPEKSQSVCVSLVKSPKV